MENNPTWVPVVALALRDGEGRILLQKRPLEKHHGGLWEFPGGKVEGTETPRFALVREIKEELDLALEAEALQPLCFAEEMGERHIVLFLYTVTMTDAEPQAMDEQEWGWFTHEAANALPLAPMDRELLERLSE